MNKINISISKTISDSRLNVNKNLNMPNEIIKEEYNNIKCKKQKKMINYNDFELNCLPYNEALKYDKRKFISYYILLNFLNCLRNKRN